MIFTEASEIIDRVARLALSFRGAEETYPFGAEPMCAKVGGKIFAELYPSRGMVTLYCADKLLSDLWRREYPGVVTRGYHCPGSSVQYRNSVIVTALPEELLREMTELSYNGIVAKLSRKVRQELGLSRE